MFYFKTIMIVIAALVAWTCFTVLSTLYGWWHSPITKSQEPEAFVAAVAEVINSKNNGNVAYVLIEDGKVFEQIFVSKSQDLDADTLFPAASMSKWVTALGVMLLAESGKVELDVPVSRYLSRWQLPPGDFNNDGVTIRRLLSHMAGLDDGLGFGDYTTDEALPTLVETLNNPRGSSNKVIVIKTGREPGTQWDYSGGGYLILQLVIEEVTSLSFDEFIRQNILDPLAMARSSHKFIGRFDNTSLSLDKDGNTAPYFQYASAAATGFNSTIADMTRLVQALMQNQLLNTDTLKQMRSVEANLFGFPIWGLGTILYAPTASGDYIYGHDGQNDPAINSAVRINPETGDAIVVFTSGNPSLATLIGFEWVFWQTGLPDFLGFGYLIDSGLLMLTIGNILIVLIISLVSWRIRR